MKRNILEIVEDYEEFKAKLDHSLPLHYHYWTNDDREHHSIVLRIYAIAKQGHPLSFERRVIFPGPNKERAEETAKEWFDNFALPLGGTPGRLKMLEGVEP